MPKYSVNYPSGRSFSATGNLSLVNIPDCGLNVCVELSSDQVVILDPRAIVSDGEDIVYSPRRHADELSQVFIKWLSEHAEWDR